MVFTVMATALTIFFSCTRRENAKSPDTAPPKVEYVVSIDTTKLLVAFNEPVDSQYTTDTLNYLIMSYETLNVHSVQIDPMKKHSFLITEPQESTFYDITIMNIRDMSGNQLKDTSFVFLGQGVQPDSFPPNVVVTYPYEGDTLYGFEYIVAYATDNTGIKRVSIYVGDSLVAEVDTYPQYCLIDARKFQEGTPYKVYATAEDFSANIGCSDSIGVFMGWHPEFPYVINDSNTIMTAKIPYRVDVTDDGTKLFFVAIHLPNDPTIDDIVRLNTETCEVETYASVGNTSPFYLDVFRNEYVYITGSSSFFIYDILSHQIERTIDAGANVLGVVRGNEEKLYLARNPKSDVIVYSIQDDSIVDSIPMGGNPTALAFDSLRNELYVCLQAQNTVSVIDTDADSIIATILLSGSPWEIVFSPNYDRAYVSEFNSGFIAELEPATHTLLDEFSVSGIMHPRGMALVNNGDYLYVTGENMAYLINAATHSVEWRFSLGVDPLSIGYSPLLERVFISCSAGREIVCIEK